MYLHRLLIPEFLFGFGIFARHQNGRADRAPDQGFARRKCNKLFRIIDMHSVVRVAPLIATVPTSDLDVLNLFRR
jgi:hypothetical protein